MSSEKHMGLRLQDVKFKRCGGGGGREVKDFLRSGFRDWMAGWWYHAQGQGAMDENQMFEVKTLVWDNFEMGNLELRGKVLV